MEALEITLQQRVDKVKENMKKMPAVSHWHRHDKFVNSISDYYERNGGLTHSQVRYFSSLEEMYSEENISAEEEWRGKYLNEQEYREIALKVANYYHHASEPYYSDIISKIMADPDGHTLSRHEFVKITSNKFSVKVLDAYKSEPRFKKGDVVELRKSHRVDLIPWNGQSTTFLVKTRLQDKRMVGFILDVDCKPITRPAKGAKVYKVLFAGEMPIYTHESDLKRAKV